MGQTRYFRDFLLQVFEANVCPFVQIHLLFFFCNCLKISVWAEKIVNLFWQILGGSQKVFEFFFTVRLF